MDSKIPEEERFAPLLAQYRWRIHHPPEIRESSLLRVLSQHDALDAGILYLPYRMPDPERVREVALYIAAYELHGAQHLLLSPLEQLAQWEEAGRQHDLIQSIADALIAPRPWIAALLAEQSARRAEQTRVLRRAARELCIPYASVAVVRSKPSSPMADYVHRRVRKLTGYPWFLPRELRDRYNPDCW